MALCDVERDLDYLENQRLLCRLHGVQEWITQVANLEHRARQTTDPLEQRLYREAANRLRGRAELERERIRCQIF